MDIKYKNLNDKNERRVGHEAVEHYIENYYSDAKTGKRHCVGYNYLNGVVLAVYRTKTMIVCMTITLEDYRMVDEQIRL